MTEVLLLIVIGLVFCFGFVVLFGAPYVPTMTKQVDTALDLLGPSHKRTLLELGCGDGKVLIAAAARGYEVIGYELNPILACIAWLRTRRYGRHVKVICGNFWHQKWPKADCVFVFLLDRYMVKLDMTITAQPQRPIQLVSFAFQVPGKDADIVRDGVYLYVYGK